MNYVFQQVKADKKVNKVGPETDVSHREVYSMRRRYAGLGLSILQEHRQ
jgi:hypothetical protein